MMKKFFLCVCLLLLFTFSIYSEETISASKINVSQIPKNISYPGKLIDARKWKDSQGEHLLLLTETGEVPALKGTDESSRDAELFAFHYLQTKGKFEQTWKIYDFTKDCPLDLEANFLPNPVLITDLNQDGITEIWVSYVTSCKGDVSPSTLKIIGYEAKKKFAVRGQTKVRISETDFVGRDFVFDKTFQEGPSSFRNFATNLWNQLILKMSQ